MASAEFASSRMEVYTVSWIEPITKMQMDSSFVLFKDALDFAKRLITHPEKSVTGFVLEREWVSRLRPVNPTLVCAYGEQGAYLSL